MLPRLEIVKTRVDGCVNVHSKPFHDDRGDFDVTWHRDEYKAVGLPTEWPQDNLTFTRKHVIRGLHLQSHQPQGKLIRCLFGYIMDVCLDLRPDSPTFGKYHREMLAASFNQALYLPPGTAHGFITLSNHSIVSYKCTTLYDPESDCGVNPIDPGLGIPWVDPEPVISEKDRSLPSLADYLASVR